MQPEYGWREVSGGVNAAGNQWLAYSGMTLAPWSSDIYSDGWRLRVGGGYGQYSYDRGIPISGECGTLAAPVGARLCFCQPHEAGFFAACANRGSSAGTGLGWTCENNRRDDQEEKQ